MNSRSMMPGDTGTAEDAVQGNLSLEVLRSFVPLNVLSDSHLNTVIRSAIEQIATYGQEIADARQLQEKQYFLVSGAVEITDSNGQASVVHAGTEGSRLSLGEAMASAALITAVTDSQLIIVDRQLLEGMLCWDQAAKTLALDYSARRQLDEDAAWMNMLLSSNLFHKIPPYNVYQIFDQFEARVVHAGETIIRQGEEGDTCYVIKEGIAVVSQVAAGSKGIERPAILAELTAGQCFGEDALLNKTTRNATVTMESNGVLMCLRKQDFFSLMVEPKVPALNLVDAQSQVEQGACWLDVRSEEEFDSQHLPGAFHLPMHLMSLKSRLMDAGKPYIAYCSSGRRASTAAYLLSQQGFNVVALDGTFTAA